MNILLLGTPASGKGTQAELLEKKFGFYHFSTGQTLRKIKDQDPEISAIMNKGDLIPDDKVLQVVEDFLTTNNLFDNLIVDGTPRNRYQYDRLKGFFSQHGTKIDMAVNMTISDEEVVKRLTARREDPKTGEVYNLITNPPGPEVNISDLIHRDDDKEEAVKERLKVQKIPSDLISALREDGILYEVGGERPIDDIFQDIVQKVENVKRPKN